MKQAPASLAGLSLSEIEHLLSPLPRLRAKQIYKWIIRGVCGFDQMTDIPVSLKKELEERFSVFSSVVESCHEDGGAKKIVLSLKDGAKIESVLLSDGKKRLTACLSTQVGCPARCVFCKTGSLGFKRNLDSSEIIEQFLLLRSGTTAKPSTHIIGNIVIMGMGEPFLNLDQLRKAIAFFTDKSALNFSRRRITVSTCGICDGLFELAKNGPFVRLALSLTTADEELRRKLMPVTAANPLQKVKETLAIFQRSGGGRLTLEVPLLGGINTRNIDAKLIADFAKGMDTVVNIIPWNPVAGLEFEGKPLREPGKKETKDFITLLEKYGLKVTMRLHKGRHIMGACGQLGAGN
jgi:23S rRNA (adenine2503-C2)-methyltransferase